MRGRISHKTESLRAARTAGSGARFLPVFPTPLPETSTRFSPDVRPSQRDEVDVRLPKRRMATFGV